MNGVIFKIYFEKTYDKVISIFFQQIPMKKGFSKAQCSLVHKVITGGSVANKFIDDVGH